MNDKHIRILLAAKDVFEKKGYHEAKISEIAMAAGVGKGTVYEYFESKASLYEKMIMYLIDLSIDHMRAELETISDVIEKLNKIAWLEAQIMEDHGQLFNLILARLPSSSDELKKKFSDVREQELVYIEHIVTEGIQSGVFKSCQVKHFAIIFKGAMMQVNMNKTCFLDDDSSSIHNLREAIFNNLIDSIKS